MNMKTLTLAVGLAVGSIGVAGVAHAVPMLQIVSNAAGDPALAANQEAIGDPGGSVYPAAPSVPPGPGLPTELGGWPSSPNFAPDSMGYTGPGGAPAYGITGYDGSYLNLTQAGNVTFQFMGKGDATDTNLFQLYLGGSWVTLFNNQTSDTCGASGSATPSIVCSNPGSSVTQYLSAGLIPFQFVNMTNPATATNDGTNNPKDIAPGFFLGMDPYLASVQYDTSGTAAYAGFTDRPPPGDHDYEDLVVRMTVPEPGSIFLLGAGLIGLAGLRRRKA